MREIIIIQKSYFSFKSDKYIYIGAIILILKDKRKVTKKAICNEIKSCLDITGFKEIIDKKGIFTIYNLDDNDEIKYYKKAMQIFNSFTKK